MNAFIQIYEKEKQGEKKLHQIRHTNVLNNRAEPLSDAAPIMGDIILLH